MSNNVTIVDYGMCNIFSLKSSLEKIGANVNISNKPDDILKSDKIIIPGVGGFPQAMANIKRLGLDEAIRKAYSNKVPIFGICLGMQLLCNYSAELGGAVGLSLINSSVKKFPDVYGYPVPQMQWNKVSMEGNAYLLSDLELDTEYFYFLHGYYVELDLNSKIKKKYISKYCGIDYLSGFENDNLYGAQFHPELSAFAGLEMLRNFVMKEN